jgi:hypothetical protein
MDGVTTKRSEKNARSQPDLGVMSSDLRQIGNQRSSEIHLKDGVTRVPMIKTIIVNGIMMLVSVLSSNGTAIFGVARIISLAQTAFIW